ncbi:MAG: LytTR family DNA-binding domain-containing protein [Bacteroidota bacterium]
MLSALLVDDEADALEVLEIQLRRHCPEVARMDSFVTAKGAMEAINRGRYDVAFLDIQLQRGAEGLRLGERLNDGHTKVVFVTAHERYALEAFKVRAFDYLLKPVEVSELKRVVREIVTVQRQLSTDHKISLKDQHRQMLVSENDIHVLAGEGNYSSVYGAGGQLIKMSVGLNKLERQLQSAFFFRCHQSYTINLRHVGELSKASNFMELLMKNGMRIPVARRRKSELETSLRKFRI